jgi:hypothetical protein
VPGQSAMEMPPNRAFSKLVLCDGQRVLLYQGRLRLWQVSAYIANNNCFGNATTTVL